MIGIPLFHHCFEGKGLDELFAKVIDVYEERDLACGIHINYGIVIEKAINTIQAEIWKNPAIRVTLSSRFIAVKLLEGDKATHEWLKNTTTTKT